MTHAQDSFGARKSLKVGQNSYVYWSLPDAEGAGLAGMGAVLDCA